MKCPHCSVSFHDNQTKQPLYYNGGYSHWDALLFLCPTCKKLTIFIEDTSGKSKMV
jgi:phage FluMu protein Com